MGHRLTCSCFFSNLKEGFLPTQAPEKVPEAKSTHGPVTSAPELGRLHLAFPGHVAALTAWAGPGLQVGEAASASGR